MARYSGRVGSHIAPAATVPLRSAVALGMVDVAVLLIRASAILLLLSPLILLAYLAFA